jgi:hypothetical protein
MLFTSLFRTLSVAKVHAPPTYAKAKQVKDFDEGLDELRMEIRALEALGVEARHQTRYSAALSLGQLAACISEFGADLDKFCRSIAIPMTYGALNPLAELHHYGRLTGAQSN